MSAQKGKNSSEKIFALCADNRNGARQIIATGTAVKLRLPSLRGFRKGGLGG